MNPVTLSNPSLFHENSFSKPADLEERISLTAENSLHFMKLEPSEADLSDLLLREWDLEFQQILDRGEKIIATLEKESNFKNQEDASNLPLSQNNAFSQIPPAAFKSLSDSEGPLPSQNAFLELEQGSEKSREEKTDCIDLKKASWAAYCKTYRAANKEKLKTYRTLYDQKNKDRKKAYRNANKERLRAYQVAYRQRQKKLKSDISLSDIQKHAPYTKA